VAHLLSTAGGGSALCCQKEVHHEQMIWVLLCSKTAAVVRVLYQVCAATPTFTALWQPCCPWCMKCEKHWARLWGLWGGAFCVPRCRAGVLINGHNPVRI
jgi:hypothetical protein